MNLTKALATYRSMVIVNGREEANRWLYSQYEPSALLRSQSPLDLIVEAINDEGEFVDEHEHLFDP